ncbi:RNA helicase required for poly(A+) mRNA export [Rhizophlyctis rosea]|uniref:RNA helicase n=1 Tax=Rhizophlyctis rosea TaxID=64517 RepID=A0AAD5S6T1_9FUNG|nr:RNA helicase required for poly(A+) mRNA export [Rhizophlyctis rosea]
MSNQDGWGKAPASAAGADGWGKPPAVSAVTSPTRGNNGAANGGWGSAPPSGSWNSSSNGAESWGKTPAPSAAPAPSAVPAPSEEDKKADPVEQVIEKVDNLTTEDDDVEITVKPKGPGLVADTEDVVEVKLSDLANDQQAELYSGIKTFEDLGLHPELLKGIYGMGFQRPSKIQEKALPLLVSNPPKNMIGQSQSGTGKTAAFVLTMLSRINYSLQAPQALCLAPARELARQIMDVIKEMGKYTPVETQFAIKESVPRGEKIKAHVVVGTPGTVMDLIKKNQLPVNNMRIFVLDEADNMLDQQGLGDQSLRVKSKMPADCQIVLFSATFSQTIRTFAHRVVPNANLISLKQEELSVDGIKQFYMDCKNEDHKVDVLIAIYGLLTVGQSIVFVRRRDVAAALAQRMTDAGHEVLVLTGAQDVTNRDQAMDDFRDGRKKVLITTNVLARGIDIAQVHLVVNFDMPLDGNFRPDPETYLHRIGRTGRFGRTGVSINFVHDQKSYEEMKAIEKHFGRVITRVPTEDYVEIEKILKKSVK